MPEADLQKCGVKGHHIRECQVEFVGAMVELNEEDNEAF